MTMQIVVMIFYAILCIVTDGVLLCTYGGKDDDFDESCSCAVIAIETLMGIWIARGIF